VRNTLLNCKFIVALAFVSEKTLSDSHLFVWPCTTPARTANMLHASDCMTTTSTPTITLLSCDTMSRLAMSLRSLCLPLPLPLHLHQPQVLHRFQALRIRVTSTSTTIRFANFPILIMAARPQNPKANARSTSVSFLSILFGKFTT